MKRWLRIAVQTILAITLGASSVLALMMYSDYPKPPAVVREAKVIHQWLTAWANDHDGRLPDRLEQLKEINLGVPETYNFSVVTEYHGAGRKLSDLPPDFLLMHCKARFDAPRGEVGREARVFASGRVMAGRPVAEPGY